MSHYTGTEWETKFIATLSGEDAHDWEGTEGLFPEALGLAKLTARVSPDGRYLAFMSDRSLTGYDNHDANSGEPDEEVFLYDATQRNRLVCASCDPTGARPVGLLEGNVEDRSSIATGNWGGRWLAGAFRDGNVEPEQAIYQSRYLSDSGRLFFNWRRCARAAGHERQGGCV